MWHVLFVNEKIDQNWPNMTVTTLPRVGGHHPVPSLNSFGYSNVLGPQGIPAFYDQDDAQDDLDDPQGWGGDACGRVWDYCSTGLKSPPSMHAASLYVSSSSASTSFPPSSSPSSPSPSLASLSLSSFSSQL